MLNVKAAAELIGISDSLVYELCRLGVIRHSRHGRPGKRGCLRIPEEAVAEYLTAREQNGAAVRDRTPLRHIR